MNHIFISYSHKDKNYAHKLQRNLQEQGFDAWVDDRIDYSVRWPREIEKRIKECMAFILIMSPNSHESDWVQNELNFARQLEKPIFPLLLDGDAWWHVSTMQYADVRKGKLPPTSFFVRLAQVADHLFASAADDEKLIEEKGSKESEKSSGRVSVHVVGEVANSLNFGEENKVQIPTPKPAPVKTQKSKPPARPGEEAEKEQADSGPGKRTSVERKKRKPLKTEYIVAIIGAIATIITGILGSPLIEKLFEPMPVSTETVTETISPLTTLSESSPTGISTVSSTTTSTPTPVSTVPKTPAPAITNLPTDITDEFGVQMVFVPRGTFLMGSENGDPDEKPVHTVYLDNYFIDKFEVTNARYSKCVENGVCSLPSVTIDYDNPEYTEHPVVFVDWKNALSYCEWRSARLPNEAEWEKAARGTDARTFPWGEGINDAFANYGGYVAGGKTTPVGQYEGGKSFYGAYDLAGNVWEWVADWYDANYYSISPSSGPSGPREGDYRVVRGGAFDRNEDIVRTSSRTWLDPAETNSSVGFRCAKDTIP